MLETDVRCGAMILVLLGLSHIALAVKRLQLFADTYIHMERGSVLAFPDDRRIRVLFYQGNVVCEARQ